jgi:hypothetical protein
MLLAVQLQPAAHCAVVARKTLIAVITAAYSTRHVQIRRPGIIALYVRVQHVESTDALYCIMQRAYGVNSSQHQLCYMHISN